MIRDDDFDGRCIHASEVGDDGWLNVVAGPVFDEFGHPERAEFEYVSASPEGFTRRVVIRAECPSWRGMGRSRRSEKMAEMLSLARSAWGDDRDLDTIPKLMVDPRIFTGIFDGGCIVRTCPGG